jgi:hypothetical protein
MNDIAKYSVDEIERMRVAVVRIYLPHPNPWGDDQLVAWERRVQERLRTFMTNGTRPEELEENPRAKDSWYDMERNQPRPERLPVIP